MGDSLRRNRSRKCFQESSTSWAPSLCSTSRGLPPAWVQGDQEPDLRARKTLLTRKRTTMMTMTTSLTWSKTSMKPARTRKKQLKRKMIVVPKFASEKLKKKLRKRASNYHPDCRPLSTEKKTNHEKFLLHHIRITAI